MAGERLPIRFQLTISMFIMALLGTASLAASERTLHNFGSGVDGAEPNGSFIWDANGNLYGTTDRGGGNGRGTVFELMPGEGGRWTERVLHRFGEGMDGANPNGALIWDANGNLYGTTQRGGTANCGTVFELTPSGNGGWIEKVIHNFWVRRHTDGCQPMAGLTWDTAGNLYGTTLGGGHFSYGSVFQMVPRGDGTWTEKVIHSFWGRGGYEPSCTLVFDAAGNLYGTTQYGGEADSGVVFRLTPDGGAGWTETKLLDFFGVHGSEPDAGLIMDGAGNLFGTTFRGGSAGFGTAFEMVPNGHGGWTEKILHNFGIREEDGAMPGGNLVLDTSGRLYGTAAFGGHTNSGTVFKLTQGEDGSWTEQTLHYFDGQATPDGSLVIDSSGTLYGTTQNGGVNRRGAAFEITP